MDRALAGSRTARVFAVVTGIALGLLSGRAEAQQALITTLAGDEPFSQFGSVVARAGDVDADGVEDIVVGAPSADVGGWLRGKAWVFSGADHSALHLFTGTTDLYELGTAVDGAGDVNDDGYADVIVGEPAVQGSPAVPGRAHVYSGFDGSVLFTCLGASSDDHFGRAVAGVGDIDGDGHDDFAVGAPRQLDVGGSVAGRVVVFSGQDASILWDIAGFQAGDRIGSALAGIGDMDGDRVPDFVVGAPGWKGDGPLPVGAVYLVSGATGQALRVFVGPQIAGIELGTNAGALGDVDGDGARDVWGGGNNVLMVWSGADGHVLHQIETWTATWDRPHASHLGDVDGDGRDDFLVGDPEALTSVQRAGHVRVISGATGSVLAVHNGLTYFGKRGTAVCGLGDTDGDGKLEYMVGEPHHSSLDPGSVDVFEIRGLPITVASEAVVETFWGWLVTSAGDVDNDGATDVLVGEPWDHTNAAYSGRARVYSGRDGSVLHDWKGEHTQDRLGQAGDGVGDLDHDGFDDVALSLPFGSASQPGSVQLRSGRTGAILLQLSGHSVSDRFGVSVAGVGDLDGDHVGDVLVGAPFDDTAGTNFGAAFAYSGSEGALLHALLGSAQSSLGAQVAGGGDVDGDGVPDLLVSAPTEVVGPTMITPGVVRIYSGASGALIRSLTGEEDFSGFGAASDAMAIVGDLDGDERAEVAVVAPEFDDGDGRLAVFSGADGSELWSLVLPCRAVAGVGDQDGDGVPDLLAGFPEISASAVGEDDGMGKLLSGVDGSVIGVYSNLRPSHLGSAIDGLGDLDFDDRSDFVMAGDGGNTPAGSLTVWRGGSGASPWENLGARLPGSVGSPTLVPSGPLAGGSLGALDVSNALPGTTAWFILGFSVLDAPFFGGTLVPDVDRILALPVSGSGQVSLQFTFPLGVPAATSLWIQAWFADDAALYGYAASSAVRGTTP